MTRSEETALGAAYGDVNTFAGTLGIGGDGTSPPVAAHAQDFKTFVERLLDPPSYVAQYADLRAAAAARPDFDPRHHFHTQGHAEGRSPSFLVQPGYAIRAYALSERRPVSPADLLTALHAVPPPRRIVPNGWFNASAMRVRYRAAYPDLVALADYEVFDFYLDHCAIVPLSPNGLFDEERYRASYPDVASAVRAGAFRSGFHHFILYGVPEQRTNLPGFGRLGTPGQTETDLLLHGPASLALDLWWYDEAFYLATNPDVHQALRVGHFLCGLEQFMQAGCREGRLPHPALSTVPAWPASAAEGPDAWGRLGALNRHCAVLPAATLDLDEACALRDLLPSRGSDRATLTEAIWPHAARPEVAALLDVPRYLAVNPDVAAAVRADDAVDPVTHWRHDGLRERRLAPGTNVFARRRLGLRDFVNWRSGVNLFGPFASATGLGQAARGTLAALDIAGIAAAPYDVSGLIRTDLPMDLAGPASLPYSINLIMLNPEQIPAFVDRYGTAIFDGRATVGSWVWELSAPRAEWKGILSGFDLLITPSDFCTEAFASFTDRPVRTVPYAVDRAALRALADSAGEPAALAPLRAAKRGGRRIVLFIMDASSYTARKGIDIFVALADRLHAAMPDRFLFCVKTHSADVSGFDGVPSDAPVVVIDGVLDPGELAALKAMADVYVSPHRSEGFGFNIIESLLLDVPALCSPHGGNGSLLGPDYPWQLPGRLAEIGRDMGPYRREAIWFEPDVAAAERALLDLLDVAPAVLAAQTRTHADRLAARLATPTVGERLRTVLAEFCALDQPADGGLRRFRHLASLPPNESFAVPSPSEDAAAICAAVGACLEPQFSVLTMTDADTTAAALTALHRELLGQSLPSWEWCIGHGAADGAVARHLRALRREDARIKLRLGTAPDADSPTLDATALLAVGTWLVLLPVDAVPTPDFLAALAGYARATPRAVLLYWDEYDEAANMPWLKPDWSPELAWAAAYVGRTVAIRKRHYLALRGLGSHHDPADTHDLLLRTSATRRGTAGGTIGHIDRMLIRSRRSPQAPSGLPAVLERHAARLGMTARIAGGLTPGSLRVRPAVDDGPVEVVIPTAGTLHPRTGTPYLESLVRSLLTHALPAHVLLRIVADPPAHALARRLAGIDPRLRAELEPGQGGSFNYAAKVNAAVRAGSAETVVLLNDDMLALDGAWLEALLEVLALPGVGVAGGRLLHPAGTIQHCGIALGVKGAATHLFHGAPADDPAHYDQTMVMRNRAAVTGAMMAFRRTTFDRAGGFDPGFPLDYNDVDFCLRVHQSGLRVVYTPHAVMYHEESASAPRRAADRLDERRFIERWAAVVRRDPWHNVNYDRDDQGCGTA